MPGPTESRQSEADLIEQAAAWLAALDAGSADMAAFQAWRDTDTRHAAAFVEVAANWRALDGLRASRDDAAHIHQPPAPVQDAPPAMHRRQALRAAAAFAAVFVAGGGFAYKAYAREEEVTAIGERRAIRLANGVKVDLNTDSCIYWRDGNPGRLWIARGEIAVDLAAHPMILITPGGTFHLTPGLYNARLRDTSCELAVLKGAARIEEGLETVAQGSVALAANGHMALRPRDDTQMDRLTAWRQDMLVLTGESLDYAVAEINRYRSNKIVIGDPSLSRLRIGGTFATTHSSEFLRALSTSFGIRAIAGADDSVILTRS